MLTETEKDLSASRPNRVDHDRIADLHFLGNYVRRLPVTMARMMENAHDWEHLPYVHASSFASIDLISRGPWGWRAKIGLPGGSDFQLVDLIIDETRHYWVSTVFSGMGTGTEIHTQATELSGDEIEVDVRFYLPEAPADKTVADFVLKYLIDQYRVLYDEDLGLMSGRQSALDYRTRRRAEQSEPSFILVGEDSELDRRVNHIIETKAGRFCVRWRRDEWIAHSAVCPHMLGPLEDAVPDEKGTIKCPWHGYRFDAATGRNLDGRCGGLTAAPRLWSRDGKLYLANGIE
ncbi:Rieske (2Fe-2S) protein [Hyphomonas pacifica]|uniref:Rieske (2Fe-2S) protein n=1 Tax=Hyphomonas pacifica TaxID=1280941 RepID=UPI000DBF823D|nr:Rieske (2Fe-2S) protein [Hyphomonas pacifica]RAN32238.1 hypothetical protein HY11_17710 [Hyphomonas pacifica]